MQIHQLPVLSPIDRESKTSVVDYFETKKIISSYAKDGYDVSRFFINKKTIELRKCEATGYRFFYPFEIFGDENFYADLQNKTSNYYPEDKWEHLTAIKYIKPGDHVLEVGCATGYFLEMIRKKGGTSVGIELNQQAIKDAVANGFKVHKEYLDEHSKKHPMQYDIVCSFQVLEHLHDISGYFNSAMNCLKPEGLLIIGVPNSNPYMYKHDKYHAFNMPPHHAGLWNKGTFKKCCQHFGLINKYIGIEPLKEYKLWYLAQSNYYKISKPILGKILSAIPRPVYKLFTRLFSPAIEGRNLLAVFQKPTHISQ